MSCLPSKLLKLNFHSISIPFHARCVCHVIQEYILPDVKDRNHLISLHKAAKKAGLDLDQYNDIKREIAEIEFDLRRLKDPLYKNLPATPPKLSSYSATEIASAKKLKSTLADYKLLAQKSNSLEKLRNIVESATKRLK